MPLRNCRRAILNMASQKSIIKLGSFAFTGSITNLTGSLSEHKAFGVVATFAGASPPAGSFQVSGSVDGVNYFGIGTATAVAANGSYFQNFDALALTVVKPVIIFTSGAGNATVDVKVCVI